MHTRYPLRHLENHDIGSKCSLSVDATNKRGDEYLESVKCTRANQIYRALCGFDMLSLLSLQVACMRSLRTIYSASSETETEDGRRENLVVKKLPLFVGLFP